MDEAVNQPVNHPLGRAPDRAPGTAGRSRRLWARAPRMPRTARGRVILIAVVFAVLQLANVTDRDTPDTKNYLTYALSLPTSVVITGCESIERLDQAVEVARTFKPLTPAQVAAILAKTRQAAMTGQFELFKTSPRFDGTARNPQWMG